MASAQNARTAYRRVAVAPLTGALGAEIRGVDLSKPLDAETRDEILAAFRDHLVVWFPDQRLSPERHLALSLMFGPHAPIPHIRSIEGFPEIQILRKDASDTNPYVIGENWHADSTYLDNPPGGVCMRAVVVPEVGGDTLFANMHQVYESLSPRLRDMLLGLRAVHSATRIFGSQARRDRLHTIKESMQVELGDREVVHPVVCAHPRSGRPFLFVNPVYTRRFEGMTEEESKGLLDYLYHHTARPQFHCRVRWRPDQVLVWDNRACQHRAIPDYPGQDRYLERTTFGAEPPQQAAGGPNPLAAAS